jgi:preprotein translocase subunit SecE
MADDSKKGLKKSKKGIGRFFKEMKTELKKVIWPDRKQLVNNTMTVLIACGIIGIFIWVVDFGIGFVVEKFLFN